MFITVLSVGHDKTHKFMAYSLFHQNMLLFCVGISHSFSVQEMLVKLPNCTEILYQTKNSNENAI